MRETAAVQGNAKIVKPEGLRAADRELAYVFRPGDCRSDLALGIVIAAHQVDPDMRIAKPAELPCREQARLHIAPLAVE